MKIANRQFVAPVLKFAGGFSLSEMLVVISVIVLLIGIGIPAAKQITDSFESSAGLRNVISTALSNARAIATKEQKYAGLRFQQDQNGRQYMIFIVHDPADAITTIAEMVANPNATGTGLANGFRAVKGLKPVKLPANAGVMDLMFVNRTYSSNGALMTAEDFLIDDSLIDESEELNETTTFSIVFSPAGKLITHLVWIRNRYGIPDSPDMLGKDRPDKVFNKKSVVDDGYAMFYQDDYAGSPKLLPYGYLGFGPEHSRNSFIIYDKRAFAAVGTDSRWTDYLSGLDVLYINSYTGEIINK